MEESDLELIRKHAKDNNKLDCLYKEHIRLGDEIDQLQASKIRSQDMDRKIRELKKIKLNGRDQMEQILQTLR